jgi:hypothetical protein
MHTKRLPPSQYPFSSLQDGQAPGSGTAVENNASLLVAVAANAVEATFLDIKVRAGGVKVDASLGKAIGNRKALVMVDDGRLRKHFGKSQSCEMDF